MKIQTSIEWFTRILQLLLEFVLRVFWVLTLTKILCSGTRMDRTWFNINKSLINQIIEWNILDVYIFHLLNHFWIPSVKNQIAKVIILNIIRVIFIWFLNAMNSYEWGQIIKLFLIIICSFLSVIFPKWLWFW